MICRTCLRRASALTIRQPLSAAVAASPSSAALRAFSISAASRQVNAASAGSAASPASHTAEPKTTPILSTPIDLPADGAAPSKTPREPSSCPAGTELTGLNYTKGQTDPVALADEEYPDWLWTCLEFQTEAVDDDAGAGDEFSKSRKQRRLAAKRQKALQAKLLAEGNTEALAPKIPLQQQSINLPGEEGKDVDHNLFAAGKREELRQAMRKERKAKIKETNYLKSM